MNGDEEGDPDEGRDLISWGCGEFGQHSHGHKEDVAFCDGLVKKFPTVPTKLIACGASHTILVTNDNEIYSWGNGNSGQLGTNIKELQWQPELVHLYENDPGTFPEVAGVACGGRHSMVWLSNGNVFSFGNNFHAQLGYDYRSKHYKENQVKPYLLKFLVHKPVIQISCGEKHSVFRFQGGTIACVGSNNNGQIGREDLEEATIPVPIEIARPVTCVASGANHNLAITDEGEVYVWGYGKGCGSKNKDIISPEKVPFKRKRVIQVAGGGAHSLALTGSGSVYVWGGGYDGQLGLGNTVTFQSSPKKLRHSKLKNNVVQIEAGESYSAALTENGDLFVWGKNSHVIRPDKPSNSKFWLPFHINKGLRPIREVVCGAWHAAAIAGRPAPLTRFHTSEVADQDSPMASPVNGAHEDHDTSSESEGDFSELPQITVKKEPTANKETSKISIADFYSGQDVYSDEGEAPSPAFLMEGSSDNLKVDTTQMDKPESAKSRIVVQVPRPSNNVVDVATSPIPFSDSDSESQSGAKTPHVLAKPVSAKVKNVPQVNLEPLQVAPNDPRFVNSIHSGSFRSDRPHTKASVQPKYFTTPPDRERSNVCKQPSTTVIQLSKSTADNFVLPRENTGFTSRQIDLTDVEYARAVNSSKSSEKLYWINKLNESREREFLGRMQNGNALLRTVTQDCNASRGASRSGRMSDTAVVNLYCYDNVLDGTPAKWNRSIESSLGDYGRQFGNGDILEEARRAARLPPKNNTPSRSIPSKKSSEANFVLQISRNDTVIAPLRAPKKNTTPRLNPMERYASVHNPASTSTKFQEKKAKLGLKTPRNVSIPDSRGNLTQEFEDICIKGETGPKQAMFSSASSWKDRGDLARMKDLRNGAMKSKTDLMISVDSKKDGTKFEKKLKMNGHDKENDLRENVTSNGKESEEDSKNGYCIEETMSDYGRMSVTQSS